jgi:hypothetical protein
LTDGRAGRLTEVARSGGGFEALAVLNVQMDAVSAADSGDGGSAAGAAVAAEQLPLTYEL